MAEQKILDLVETFIFHIAAGLRIWVFQNLREYK
jgi:hypothetical protein